VITCPGCGARVMRVRLRDGYRTVDPDPDERALPYTSGLEPPRYELRRGYPVHACEKDRERR